MPEQKTFVSNVIAPSTMNPRSSFLTSRHDLPSASSLLGLSHQPGFPSLPSCATHHLHSLRLPECPWQAPLHWRARPPSPNCPMQGTICTLGHYLDDLGHFLFHIPAPLCLQDLDKVGGCENPSLSHLLLPGLVWRNLGLAPKPSGPGFLEGHTGEGKQTLTLEPSSHRSNALDSAL